MIDEALQIIAPHLCLGCGKIGPLLCQSCRYDIVNEPYGGCLVCGVPSAWGICQKHTSPIDGAWIAGERDESLARLIDAFKFERCKSAHKELAGILAELVPILPEAVTVTSIPTVRAHVRERGYDHAKLIAKNFAKRRNLPHRVLLARQSSERQRGASRKERFKQAERAFAMKVVSDIPETVLLIDDVVTTGATLHFAAKLLKESGVKTILVAAIAKQPLDQTGKI